MTNKIKANVKVVVVDGKLDILFEGRPISEILPVGSVEVKRSCGWQTVRVEFLIKDQNND